MPAILPVGLFLSLAASAPPHDWLNSAYTEAGVEVRVDERVIALFDALNRLGYDAAPAERPAPVPRREFTAVRKAARAVGLPAALDAEWQKAMDEKPEPVARWVEAALAGSIDSLLDKTWAEGGSALVVETAPALRVDQVAMAKGIDPALKSARALLKIEGPAKVQVIVNPLDGRGHGYAVPGETWRLVVGPAPGGADVGLAVAQWVRLAARPLAEKAAPKLKDGASALEVARGSDAVSSASVADWVAENLGRAVGVKVTGGTDKDAQEHAKLGFFLVPDLLKALPGLEKAKGTDAWLAETLAKADARKPAARSK
jgi:hypothetical protein